MHNSKKLKLISVFLISSMLLSGCASLATGMQEAMNNDLEPVISVNSAPSTLEKKELTWVELDQLNTFKDIRRTWDDTLGILRFDISSKNGVLFVDEEGNWSGNNTMYTAFRNKAFMTDYYSQGSIRSELAEPAIATFNDIKSENAGILAAVNAYFNIIATNTEGSSGMNNVITRAEAMSAIYRADTPVTLNEVPDDFVNVVGENVYNEYAYNMTPYSYLDYKNGSLNSTNYNLSMTKGEFIYMLVKRYFPDEYNNASSDSFSDAKDAGDIATDEQLNGHASQAYVLEYCLQSNSNEVCSDLYKAFVVAKNKGIISSETKWKDALLGGDVISMLISTYQAINSRDNFKINANMGANTGASLYVREVDEDEPEITEHEISITTTTHKLSDLADIDDLIKAYGDEINMTPEEIEEAKQVGELFTIEEFDAYLNVDHCTALNVRTGPNTDYRIIKCVPKGTKAHIVGVCSENGWYRVIADGKICYQCGVYFSEITD